ncbi:MAG: hypothetical protein ACK4WM_04590 [Thermoflexales bacterium]
MPIFINEGEPTTNRSQIAVQLAQEEVFPEGSPTAIGRVVEIRLRERPDFADTTWRAWGPLVPFTLSPGAGTKSVFVQMRDAAGRIALAAASITYDPFQPAPRRPTPMAEALAAAKEDDDWALAEETPEPLPTPLQRASAAPTAPVPEPTVPLVLPQASAHLSPPTVAIVLPTSTSTPAARPPDAQEEGGLGRWLGFAWCKLQSCCGFGERSCALALTRPEQRDSGAIC